jgi:uncharacterized protein involved in exopolysaccharide biosynthesis/Mrp family chromosome partitioning ATPase
MAMTDTSQQAAWNGFDFRGILFALFKHKWKISLCAITGVAAAAIFYICRIPVYESEAKLLVRYVVERSAIDSIDSQDGAAGSRHNDNVINSEVEILTSWDIAKETAEAVGPERLLTSTPGPKILDEAALSISKGVVVTARKGSSVITVSFSHPDAEIATNVLQELVSRYFAKHLEVHRSTDAFDFVSQQTEQIRERLRNTEEELKQLRSKAGVISLGDSATSFTTQLAKSQSELLAAEAEKAEQTARVKEIEKWLSGGPAGQSSEIPRSTQAHSSLPAAAPSQVSVDNMKLGVVAPREPAGSDIQKYQALIERLASLRQSELELLSRYTPENELVKVSQAEIQGLDSQRRQMERLFPSLLVSAVAKGLPTLSTQPDIMTERARLAAIEAKVDMLRLQAQNSLESFKTFAALGMQITQLERRKEVEEVNYKYFESSLEKARIDEALDPSKMPNISVVQKPSTAIRVTGKSKKFVLGLAAGGLAFGIGIALFLEFMMDRSVKRAAEIERGVGLPLLRSIPYVTRSSHSRPPLQNGRDVSSASPKTIKVEELHRRACHGTIGPYLRPYWEEIRDRIILHFDLNRLTHKPKLVAVTSCDAGAGTSTIAAGLAASLSETGDGKVLLVDMNAQQAEVHPFFDGNPACPLTEAIEPGRQIVSASQNLYLATASTARDTEKGLLSKRFSELFPSLKASDFDYIIFDMPPLSRSTTTLAIAKFMDKVLLVIEAEKTRRESIKRFYGELVGVKADVTGIFNKTRSYLPKWLGIEE